MAPATSIMIIDPAHLKEVEIEFDSATDRGAAIVSASFLETLLTDILKNFLITDPKTDDWVWGAYAPLSSGDASI